MLAASLAAASLALLVAVPAQGSPVTPAAGGLPVLHQDGLHQDGLSASRGNAAPRGTWSA